MEINIMQIIYLVAGLGISWIAWPYLNLRTKGLREFVKANQKKNPVAILETDKASYCLPIKKTFMNLAITDDKQIIIIPDNSAKPCMNLGGHIIIHGDLYKSLASTRDLRLWANEVKEKYNWTDNDIAMFLQEVEKTPMEEKKKYLAKLIKREIPEAVEPMVDKEGNPIIDEKTGKQKVIVHYKNPSEDDKNQYSVYMSLPTTIKNYVYTGINRTSILSMLRELVYQQKLESKPMNIIMWGILVVIIGVVGVVVLPRILPYLANFFPASAPIPATIPGPSVVAP